MSYSEDYQDIKIPRKEIFYKFLSIAVLHSVVTKGYKNKYYPQAYMEKYKYERIKEKKFLILIMILTLILKNNLFIT